MQRRRMAEANAFVPLDTNSPEDQLVVRLTPAGSTTASLKSKKKSMSKLPSTTFGRWFRRNKSTGQDQSSPVASHDSAHSHHRHHQSMDEKPSSATSFPHTTATSMSDRASFEQYQYDKWTLIQEGLKGLSNSNIAHALGANNPHSHNHNRHSSSLISVLFSTSATESSSSAAAAAVLANKEPKRDSGISLFAALSSSSSSKKKAHQIHREPPSEPANSPQQISCDSDGFLALRYPCMVHLQTLRSAAIHVLSSDMTLDTSVHTPRSSCCISESNKNSCCCPSTPATTPQPS
ncbi:hypothetical protein BCR43DRAFT_483550 [Syncephalastrum racemosum]|uniref:Uncharacterized protein n=1 Tax=Syncephalastrum racemosum TaxID=13706 RepID=A0A1X2HVC6_SYNRA|nr:hypothetical protein BCR43DRAFT_483550 [Syncephalastrum racemosum]